jgi:transposase
MSKRIIQYLGTDMRRMISSAARTFWVAVSTVNGLVWRFEARGSTAVLPKGGARRTKLVQSAINMLALWTEERPDVTLWELKICLATEQGIVVTNKTISNALKHSGFTVKLLWWLPASRNCPATIEAGFVYAQKYLNEAPVDHRSIIWIDECGFNLHIRHTCGHSRCGERASITVANGRGHNISVCVAMSEEGFLHKKLWPGAYNAKEFCVYLWELFTMLEQMGGRECWLILDNVPFHLRADIVACVHAYGHGLVFLSLYSPMLNPI